MTQNAPRSPNLLRSELPPLPAKPFFTVAEAVELVAVPERLLRQWEREFAVGPRRGRTRRRYRREEILLLRRIRRLVLDEGRALADVRQLNALNCLAEEAMTQRLQRLSGELAAVENALAAVVQNLNTLFEEPSAEKT